MKFDGKEQLNETYGILTHNKFLKSSMEWIKKEMTKPFPLGCLKDSI